MPRPTADEKAKARIAQLEELVASQRDTIEMQAVRISEVIEQLSIATAKPHRKFRRRVLEHGPLQITVKPMEEIGNDEVYVEHVGESLVVLVGAAAQAARGGAIVPQARLRIPIGESARPAQTVEAQGPVEGTSDIRPAGIPEFVRKLMQSATDVNAAIAIGAQYGVSAEDASAIAIGAQDLTAGLLPPELVAGPPNAVLQKQGDPKRPGGYQIRDTISAAQAREYGWDGVSPRPTNWVDPDRAPDATTH